MKSDELIVLLKELQASPKESEWIEFKVNNYNPEEIGEYLSSLSNSACYHNQPYGFLAFGIENKTHRLVGTNYKPSIEKIGNQEIENWLATLLEPRIDFNIFEVTYDQLNFVIFRVNATHSQPVNFKGTPYIRIGSYKKKLKEHPEKERSIWGKTASLPFEKQIAIHNLTEDDVLNLIEYPKYFNLIKFPQPHDKKIIINKLKEDKVIFKKDGLFAISNVSAILFATDIEKFENLSRKAVRVIIYDGIDRIKTIREQIGVYGYAIGFEGLIKYITDQLPTKEIIISALRTSTSVYPSLAIRELVANAIIHQDFSITGTSPMIEIFTNRIEITNPGQPIIDTLRFMDHLPQSRNETLAKQMRFLNICEERGSGIDKIVFECEINQLPAPDFIVGENYTRAIIYAPIKFSQMDKEQKIRACYYHCCLRYLSKQIMTNQSLRERFKIDEKNSAIASRIISDTKDAALIKEEDPTNKSFRYVKYIPFWA